MKKNINSSFHFLNNSMFQRILFRYFSTPNFFLQMSNYDVVVIGSGPGGVML